MNSHSLIGAVLIAVSMPLSAAVANNDASSIRELEKRQEEAWNAHDARRYAHLFAADADSVNVLGWWWKGHNKQERKHATSISFVFAHSVLHVDEVVVR